MLTSEEITQNKHVHTETFKVNAIERAQLHTMAVELGVPKSALIRDGLQKVYSEFQAFQQAADHDSTHPAN
jgi:hypothetical protein